MPLKPPPESTDGWYWVDTGYACGGIKVVDGRVVQGAPIFNRMIGRPFSQLVYRKIKRLDDPKKRVPSFPTGLGVS